MYTDLFISEFYMLLISKNGDIRAYTPFGNTPPEYEFPSDTKNVKVAMMSNKEIYACGGTAQDKPSDACYKTAHNKPVWVPALELQVSLYNFYT